MKAALYHGTLKIVNKLTPNNHWSQGPVATPPQDRGQLALTATENHRYNGLIHRAPASKPASATKRGGALKNGDLQDGRVQNLVGGDFQQAVSHCLIRHRSVLDIVTKLQEASARVNRAMLKAATTCGCVAIMARKPQIPPDLTLDELRQFMPTHIEGELCPGCREVMEDEIGALLFFTAALCSTSDLNLQDIMNKERRKLYALGVFFGS